jgi:phenylpyruvate tautomerase PptA (4-oxalocrotonate tautomerase family)
MPMLDVTIPEGALSEEAERALLSRLTDVLLEHEGADPTNPVARSVAWVFLHRPAAVFVAGEPESEPHYRVVVTVPQGQFDDDRRAAMVAAVTESVLDAEDGMRRRDPSRVWVFPTEMPDGTWGAAGQIVRLADIVSFVGGVDRASAERYAARRLGREQAPAPA